MRKTRSGKLKTAQGRAVPSGVNIRELDRLIDEAVVDAYNESEQRAFYTMVDENLDLPFKTEVLGIEVTVKRVDLTDPEEIVPICARGR